MGVKVHVICYSMYGHVYRMAEAVLAGVEEVAGGRGVALPGCGACAGCNLGEIRSQRGARGVCARSNRDNGLACGAASGDFWDAYEVWKHGCTDAEFSRSDRRVVGQGHADR